MAAEEKVVEVAIAGSKARRSCRIDRGRILLQSPSPFFFPWTEHVWMRIKVVLRFGKFINPQDRRATFGEDNTIIQVLILLMFDQQIPCPGCF